MNTEQAIGAHLPEPTILVTDDNPAIVQLVGNVLRVEGYRVLTAKSPFEALHLAQRHSVDLLLSDIEMRSMDGTALWRALKRWHPEVKLILMSGSAALTSVPCVPFLAKPFTLSQLTEKVRASLYPERCLETLDGKSVVHPSKGAVQSPTEFRRRGTPRLSPGKRGTDDAA